MNEKYKNEKETLTNELNKKEKLYNELITTLSNEKKENEDFNKEKYIVDQLLLEEKNKFQKLYINEKSKNEQLSKENSEEKAKINNLNQKISEMVEEKKQYIILKNDFDKLNSEKSNYMEEKNKFDELQKELEKYKAENNIIVEKNNNIEFEKNRIEQLYNEFLNKFIDEKNKYDNLKKIYENQKKLFNEFFPFELLNEKEKILNINFITFDESIYYTIICKNTDKISNIIKIFYDNYSEYKEFKNIFRFNGKEINIIFFQNEILFLCIYNKNFLKM